MTNRKPLNSSRCRVLAGGSAYAALSVLGFPAVRRRVRYSAAYGGSPEARLVADRRLVCRNASSHSKILLPNRWIGYKCCRRAAPDNASFDDNMTMLCDLRQRLDVLIDDEQGIALRLERLET